MDISNACYDATVHSIYEAALRPLAWRDFFAALGRAIDASTVHLVAVDKRQGILSYSDGHNLPSPGRLAHLRQDSRIGARIAAMTACAPGRWLHSQERCNACSASASPFVDDLLVPDGLCHVSGCKLLDDETACVFFSVSRGPRQPPFGAEEIGFLERLTPHLQRAAQLQSNRFVSSTQALIGHALVNKLRQPVALLEPNGTMVSINDACRRLLEATPLLRAEGGALRLPEPYQQEFTRGCEALVAHRRRIAEDDSDEPAGYHTLQVCSSTHPPDDVLFAFYTVLMSEDANDIYGMPPLMLVLFHHPATAAPLDAELLAPTFDLTPCEMRVSRLLAGGYTPKEIAVRVGVQHDTVRKQLQSIYRKTTTCRQADLIRLMVSLPSNAFLA